MTHASIRIFTLDDIRRLIKRHARLLLCAVWIGALWGFLFVIKDPPTYKLQATFEVGVEQPDIDPTMKGLLLSSLSTAQECKALVLMQTHSVLRPVIEKHGLQASIKRSWFHTFLHRVRDHLRSQCALPMAEPDDFEFEQVRYEGEEPLELALVFQSRDRFAIVDVKGSPLSDGFVGRPVTLDCATFTCSLLPQQLLFDTPYHLSISPWIDIKKTLGKTFRIVKQKNCQSICDLTLYWPNRFLGAQILNDIMREYRAYLKRDRDEVAKEQIAYLEAKQSDICQRFENLFEDHAKYLSSVMKEKGFIGLEQEMRNYLESHDKLCARLFAIEIEEERLQNGNVQDREQVLGKELGPVYQELRTLAHERGVLLRSLPGTELIAQGLEMQRKGEMPQMSQMSQMPWSRAAASYGEEMPLDSVRSLYAEYSTKLDASESAIESIGHFQEKLKRGELDMSAFASLFKDPLSGQLIARASELSLQSKDIAYSSPKERERWKEEIELQRRNLIEHLVQLEQLEVLNAQMMRDKIIALQRAIVGGIDGQISVLQQQIQEVAMQRIANLQDEKRLLERKKEQLRLASLGLPEKWKLETWLKVKTDMGKKMMTVITELVESKTIGRHLHHIESKPLEWAEVPFLTHRSLLFSLIFVGALGAFLILFWGLFLQTLLKGFPMTGAKLKALGYPYSGESGSLQTLRQISLFLHEPAAQVIALLGEQGPNDADSLAKHLQRTGPTVCVVHCDFEHEGPLPGFAGWLNGELENLPIQRGAVHWIPAGASSPFAYEMLQSDRFREGLAQLKQTYRFILLWNRSPIDAAEARTILQASDRAVVSIGEQQTEQLTPLLHWAYHEGSSRITFISSPG